MIQVKLETVGGSLMERKDSNNKTMISDQTLLTAKPNFHIATTATLSKSANLKYAPTPKEVSSYRIINCVICLQNSTANPTTFHVVQQYTYNKIVIKTLNVKKRL